MLKYALLTSATFGGYNYLVETSRDVNLNTNLTRVRVEDTCPLSQRMCGAANTGRTPNPIIFPF